VAWGTGLSKKKKKPAAGPAPETTRTAETGTARDRVQHWVAWILLAGLVLAAYSNSFQAGWHFDDRPNILENPYFWMSSLSPASLLQAMVQDFNQNRPFSNLTLALNYYFNRDRVWGYQDRKSVV
jgi:hypothetical protein